MPRSREEKVETVVSVVVNICIAGAVPSTDDVEITGISSKNLEESRRPKWHGLAVGQHSEQRPALLLVGESVLAGQHAVGRLALARNVTIHILCLLLAKLVKGPRKP